MYALFMVVNNIIGDVNYNSLMRTINPAGRAGVALQSILFYWREGSR